MRRRPAFALTALVVAVTFLPGVAAPAQAADPASPTPAASSASSVSPTAGATLAPAAGVSAAPAAAAPATVRMTFDAGPEPVAKGTPITLTGRVWRTARGNRARVDFYFHANGTPATSFTYQGFATTTDAGNFSRSYTAKTTGTWKAVYTGSTSRRNAARLDAVQVYQRRSREIAGWSEQTSSWQSPTLRIPTADYKALLTWTCTNGPVPFIYLTWTGQGGGSEYVHGAKPEGTLTLNGHAGARKGFFRVNAAADCAWRVRIFSGIAAFQV